MRTKVGADDEAAWRVLVAEPTAKMNAVTHALWTCVLIAGARSLG
jgi:hypothetical protein